MEMENAVLTKVKKRLENTSIDLGTFGLDNIYGAGLVNAYNAIN